MLHKVHQSLRNISHFWFDKHIRSYECKRNLFFSTLALQKELNCLTNNIFYEAESESFKGKLAVAQVTMNRVRSVSIHE
jgi:spore germination cell wall hydrolase CwlJ-like protein